MVRLGLEGRRKREVGQERPIDRLKKEDRRGYHPSQVEELLSPDLHKVKSEPDVGPYNLPSLSAITLQGHEFFIILMLDGVQQEELNLERGVIRFSNDPDDDVVSKRSQRVSGTNKTP
ncbi:unnamed protein product [Phaedon cochleariae]|uniref:Uncharacterized protein n=1 Tax=Phaedon cochleariae TaxID=80249 RepID=A0A9N9WXV1_PHACE|nr:unnamed protein product [Phaedon cochleariae]